MKKTFAFIFFMLAAILLGAFVSHVCGNVSFLSWLAWGKTFGVNDFTFDLNVLSLSVSLTVNFTVAQLITIPIALIIYAKTCKSL
jgi:hypothetical protein